MFFKNIKPAKIDNNGIEQAVIKAIKTYIAARREKIPNFIQTHFSLKGALKLHKKALSSDLYKSPINIFWALPYTGLKAAVAVLKKIGSKKIPVLFEKLPHGFETNVQKEVTWLIYTELLEIPCITVCSLYRLRWD